MKLRLTENAVRLRLESAELNDFAVLGRIEETVEFGPGEAGSLRFALESSDEDEVRASLEDGLLTIAVPKPAVRRWTTSGDVGIEAIQHFKDRKLEITVEKDLGRRTLRGRHH